MLLEFWASEWIPFQKTVANSDGVNKSYCKEHFCRISFKLPHTHTSNEKRWTIEIAPWDGVQEKIRWEGVITSGPDTTRYITCAMCKIQVAHVVLPPDLLACGRCISRDLYHDRWREKNGRPLPSGDIAFCEQTFHARHSDWFISNLLACGVTAMLMMRTFLFQVERCIGRWLKLYLTTNGGRE